MTDALAARLAAIVGEAHVLRDDASRALAGSDLFDWPGAVAPTLVVRPADGAQTAAALRMAGEARASVVPRGAGLSYTAGAVPHAPAIVFDMTRLAAVEIDAEDMFAHVGAGATWEAVAAAAAAHGLRVADGTLARTGSAARAGGSPFWRSDGPDLTGLFLGDCGAFGIKTAVVLRLVPERPAAFASFGFDGAAELVAALVALMRAGAVSRGFAIDRLRSRAATSLEAGEAARTVGAVVARAGSVGQALRDVAQLARASLAEAPPWALHLTAEADTPRAAEERLDAARRICAAGREIDAVVPKTLRTRPFSIRGMVGPEGERWVPVHGILPPSRAVSAMVALERTIAAEQPAIDAAGMSVNWLVSSMGAYVVIEPMFYWRDALAPIHLAALSEKNRARFGAFVAAPEGRALARRLRVALRDVLDAHGAVHAQIGRFYRFTERMDPGSAALVRLVKAALDPEGRMNPGVLGL
jgi:FAD/FMN-containing dehydrogenase